jgi:hypothetical protein
MKQVSYRILGLSLLLALSLSGCIIEIEGGTTDTPDIGTTVFAGVRWQDPSRAMDVVFFADEGYGALTTQSNLDAFLADVSDAIDSGFYQNNMVFKNITMFNFWYSTRAGADVERNPTRICPNVTWPLLTDATFADMRVILHRETDVRDCGGGGSATAQAGSTNWWIIVHESGHAMFGLPDEYCCDGGYWNSSPILYDSSGGCTGDAANSTWRNCIQLSAGTNTRNWWRSQGTNIDLMRDAGPPVWELGPAGWARVRIVLDALPSPAPTAPDVFAPTDWIWN